MTMKGLFITATGTEIGKTLVTAALTHQLRQAGHVVGAIKPIISGITEGEMEGTDTAIIASAMGQGLDEATLDTISPFRYKAPLAPSMAASLEGKVLDYNLLIETCRKVIDHPVFTLVEGVGGAFVPLTDDKLVADWIGDLDLSAIIVAGSYLGTLSHIISTLEAMQARGLDVRGIVVSESTGDTPDFDDTLAEIRHWTKLPVIGIPRLHGAEPWQQAPDLTGLVELDPPAV
ncbi:dethiobiotin synthase [Kordiimonas marina]|uniref:dethiobiotin synthase n=1 Tax=Kordiimonas marina TaxID=2872312 RepID=UPI001FF2CF87|nr:dethiobiotin synthase [Kordiimonas marina]MCJ9428339.1 dethiobiotin synthase [Kordiimonas marina]